MNNFFIKGILIMALLVGGFYYLVVKEGKLDRPVITNFEECRAAGYPVMESYPEQCRSWDGTLFIREIDEQVYCTADAIECPDGSYVGRTGPNCEFICSNN